MSFSSAEEFAQYLAKDSGETPLSDKDPNKNKAGLDTPSRTGKLASFISSVQAMSPTMSPKSPQSRESRSPSEYSICSVEPDEHPSSEFFDVELITEDGTQLVNIGSSDMVHEEVRRLLRDPTSRRCLAEDCEIRIQYAGAHIGEKDTFEECQISENTKLDVFLIPKRFKGTIKAEGWMGLTLFIRHDAQTGQTTGVELGEVGGAALEAGFLGHDVLIEVDGIDIRKKTFPEVQGIFMEVKSSQSDDSWQGLVLTIDRTYAPEKAHKEAPSSAEKEDSDSAEDEESDSDEEEDCDSDEEVQRRDDE